MGCKPDLLSLTPTKVGREKIKTIWAFKPKYLENKKKYYINQEINQICNVPRADKNKNMN